jgi:hypothetical protein
MDLSANWTPLVRATVLGLFALYVVDLVTGGLLSAFLAWHPLGAGFAPWQVLTCWLVGVGQPFNELMCLLSIFFLLPLLERLFSRARILRNLLLCWGLGAGLAFAGIFSGLAADTGVPSALIALLAAMMGLIGYSMPNTRFLFMMVVPVRASWLAHLDGLLGALNVLASRDSASLAPLGAWIGSVLVVYGVGGPLRRSWLRVRRGQIERKLARFEVIDGGKGGKPARPRRGNDPKEWMN